MYLKSVSNSPDQEARQLVEGGIHDRIASERGNGTQRNVWVAAGRLGNRACLRIGPLALIDQCICRGCDYTASGRGPEVPQSTRHVRPRTPAGAGLPRPGLPVFSARCRLRRTGARWRRAPPGNPARRCSRSASRADRTGSSVRPHPTAARDRRGPIRRRAAAPALRAGRCNRRGGARGSSSRSESG